jgi:rRNA maturation endonuclease Nob1
MHSFHVIVYLGLGQIVHAKIITDELTIQNICMAIGIHIHYIVCIMSL